MVPDLLFLVFRELFDGFVHFGALAKFEFLAFEFTQPERSNRLNFEKGPLCLDALILFEDGVQHIDLWFKPLIVLAQFLRVKNQLAIYGLLLHVNGFRDADGLDEEPLDLFLAGGVDPVVPFLGLLMKILNFFLS